MKRTSLAKAVATITVAVTCLAIASQTAALGSTGQATGSLTHGAANSQGPNPTVLPNGARPEPPTNVKKQRHPEGGVMLGWTDSTTPQTFSFEIFRDGTKVATVHGERYHDEGGNIDSRYYLRSRAWADGEGLVAGRNSSLATTVDRGLIPPKAPTNGKGVRYSRTAGLISWDRSSDPDGHIVGYRITRYGGELFASPQDTLSVYQDDLDTFAYHYRVWAVDNDGNESPSVAIKIPAHESFVPYVSPNPDPPTNIKTTRYSSTSGLVSWDRATDSDGHVIGYQIKRDGSDLFGGEVQDTLSVYENSLSSGDHIYWIRSVDNDGRVSGWAVVILKL